MIQEAPLFFIVGAQKAGTTSLYKYLGAHPDIYMPIEKEIPFFDKTEIDQLAWAKYRETYLTPRRGERIAGTSSPQYMCDYRVPGRIAEYAPNAKIIIILRDPIERAVSHYKMLVSRGAEHREFEDAITEQLLPYRLQQEREKKYEEIIESGEQGSYVCRGEYKRIVDLYRHHFPRSVLVICSQSLRDRRKKTVEDVLRFLEVRESILPNTLSTAYHRSNASVVDKLKKWIAQSESVRLLAKMFFTKRIRKYVVNNHLTYLSRDVKSVNVNANVYRSLVEHYQKTNAGMEACMDGWFKRSPSQDGNYIL